MMDVEAAYVIPVFEDDTSGSEFVDVDLSAPTEPSDEQPSKNSSTISSTKSRFSIPTWTSNLFISSNTITDEDEGWICSQCSYTNADGNSSRCAVCGSKRGANEETPVTSGSVASPPRKLSTFDSLLTARRTSIRDSVSSINTEATVKTSNVQKDAPDLNKSAIFSVHETGSSLPDLPSVVRKESIIVKNSSKEAPPFVGLIPMGDESSSALSLGDEDAVPETEAPASSSGEVVIQRSNDFEEQKLSESDASVKRAWHRRCGTSTFILILGLLLVFGGAAAATIFFLASDNSSDDSPPVNTKVPTPTASRTSVPTNVESTILPTVSPTILSTPGSSVPLVPLGIDGISGDGTTPFSFGQALSVSRFGNIVAIGSPESSVGVSAGLTQVFRLDKEGENWNPMGSNLVDSQGGDTVVLSDNGATLVVSSSRNNYMAGIAVAYRFMTMEQKWSPLGQDIGMRIGGALEISGNGEFVAVGEEDGIQAYKLNSQTDSWTPLGQLIEDGQAVSVSHDGTSMVVGTAASKRASLPLAQVYDYDLQTQRWVSRGDALTNDIAGVVGAFAPMVSLSDNGKWVAVGTEISEDDGSYLLIEVFRYDESTGSFNHVGQPLQGAARSFVNLSRNGRIVSFLGPNHSPRLLQFMQGIWISPIEASDIADGVYDITFSVSGNGEVIALSDPTFNNGNGQVKLFQLTL